MALEQFVNMTDHNMTDITMKHTKENVWAIQILKYP